MSINTPTHTLAFPGALFFFLFWWGCMFSVVHLLVHLLVNMNMHTFIGILTVQLMFIYLFVNTYGRSLYFQKNASHRCNYRRIFSGLFVLFHQRCPFYIISNCTKPHLQIITCVLNTKAYRMPRKCRQLTFLTFDEGNKTLLHIL